MADLFPLSVILHFPSEVYLSRGVGDLCPLLVRALHASKISALQFLRGGRVRATFREPAFREELLSNDLLFEDRKIPVTPAGVQVVTVYVRDLPVEVSNESIKSAFSAYGEVYSVRHGFYKDFPDLQNSNRLILMSVSNQIPSSPNVLGFACRVWHPGQPVHCSICKESGHSPDVTGSEDDEDSSSVSSDQPDPVLPPDVPAPKSPSAKMALVLKKLVRAARFKYKTNPDPTQVREYISSLIATYNLVVSPSELDQIVKNVCKSNV